MGIEDPSGVMFTAKMLGTCIAVFFGICFFIGLLGGDKLGIKPLVISDKIDLGYIRDNNPVVIKNISVKPLEHENQKQEIQHLKYKLEKMRIEDQLRSLQRKKVDRKKKKKCEQSPLMKDCVDAMVSMGENKRDAVNKVTKYFNNHPNTNNVNDFILGVFKK